MSMRRAVVLLVGLGVGLAVMGAPVAAAVGDPPPAGGTPASAASTPLVAPPPDEDLTQSSASRASNREGRPLSGNLEADGHTLTWAVSGAEACPAAVVAVAADCSGVVRPGVAVTLTATTSFSLGEGAVTNLSQDAGLSLPGVPSRSGHFSERVGGGTYTHTWTLTLASPPSSADDTATSPVLGYGSASVSSRNCNDWGVCGGPAVQLQIVLVRGASATDTTKPLVSVTPYTAIVTAYPVKVAITATDDKGKVRAHTVLYSGGSRIGGVDMPGFTPGGRFTYSLNRLPSAKGPFYLCAWAEDQAGNRSQGAPKSSCTWLSLVVPVSRVSNGCGTGEYGAMAEWLQNYFGNDRYYGHGAYRVQVKAACDMHDAGYAGVTAYDPFLKRAVDFRTWSRQRVDAKFRENIQAKCRFWLTTVVERRYLPACLGGLDISGAAKYFALWGWDALQDQVGANVYYDAVRSYGGVGYDADVTVGGIQNTVPARTVPPGGGRNNT